MSQMFAAIKNLFPLSKAFQLFADNNKRKLIKGLSRLPENIRSEIEMVYGDLFPDTTRFPEKWESVFAIFFKEEELIKRREILDSLWKINQGGGQTALFLQDVLQKIIPNIMVIENVPVKNPRDGNIATLSVCNYKTMRCGNSKAVAYYRIGDPDFVPSVLQNDSSDLYSISDNPYFWGNCFYICQSIDRNSRKEIIFIKKIKIEKKWKNYIEYLILKLKPVHTTAVLYIEWEE